MRVPKTLPQRLRKAKRIAVTSHISPEGDALGSALALMMALQGLGKRVEVIFHDGVPKRYAFLPNVEKVRRAPSIKPDLLILVDCADLDRADLPQDLKEAPPSIVVIDHHLPKPETLNRGPETENFKWIEPKAAATGEMIAALLRALGVPMTKEIATCLYAALVADTGVFHFANTTPKVLRLAAQLLRHGVDPQELAYRVMEVRSFAATRLLARMLTKAKFEPEFGLTWSALSLRDFEQTGTTDEDTENFVNFLRAVEGTRVAVLFRQVRPDRVRVSLRAKDNTNVAAIARKFGGGGHPAAAGCRLKKPLKQAVRQVLRVVWEVLKKEGRIMVRP